MPYSDPNTEKPLFQKIGFIHYPARNRDVTLKFYRDTLGLALLHGTDEWLEFAVGDTRLAFRKTDESTPSGGLSGAMAWLQVTNLEQSMEILKNKGVVFIQGPLGASWGKTAVFVDPDGNRLGLYEPPRKKR